MATDDMAAEDVTAPVAPDVASRMSGGDRVRFVLRGIGQTLITLGLVVLLFVVYEVWITNIFAHRAQARVHSALEREWKNGDDPLLALPGTHTSTIPLGTGIANLYMPRLGPDYHWTIVQGTGDADLEKGPGHYVDTALPGQIGNFSIAGHRVGKGEPFLNLDKLRSGDAVIVETRSFWYVYDVLGTPAGANPQTDTPDPYYGTPGREIVDPSAGRVLLPVPNHAGVRATKALMTMTTCHPKFTASQRMIIHAVLTQHYPRISDTMPAQVQALYQKVTT